MFEGSFFENSSKEQGDYRLTPIVVYVRDIYV